MHVNPQMDSFVVYVVGKRCYFSCVIDVVTKYAYCAMVPSLAAKHAVTTLQAFIAQYQYAIRVVQTDNGSEFLGVFHQFLEERGVEHLFSYPHSPKTNSTVERFNRIVQEECLNRCDELWYNTPRFTRKLADFLKWYNTQRPHHSLKLQSPMQYMQQFV